MKRSGADCDGDARWMRRAIRLAQRGVGLTSPNPPVGAVIVRGGKVLGEGWHRKAGEPHAEVEAILDAARKGNQVKGATIYVTLEPCSTVGRTGACTDAIVRAGISRVVYGSEDPNPSHVGAADSILTASHIEVLPRFFSEESDLLYREFSTFIQTGRPYVIAKAGMTLDGRISRPAGEGQWITSEEARADAMSLRVRSDAILVGGGTARADNPKLTLRGADIPEGKVQPLRVVLSKSRKLPADCFLLSDEFSQMTKFVSGDLGSVLDELGGLGVGVLLVEGGGEVLGSFANQGLVDEFVFYIAPRLGFEGVSVCASGSLSGSLGLEFLDTKEIGSDLRITARPLQ